MKRFVLILTGLLLVCMLAGCGQVIEPWRNIQIPEYPDEIATVEPSTTSEPQTTEEPYTGTKPSGLVLNPDRIPTVEPYNPETSFPDDSYPPETSTPEPTQDTSTPDVTTPEVSTPTERPTQEITESKLTQGLKNALSQFGHTTSDGINFVAYSPIAGADGGICIIHIASNSTVGIQKIYFYYESDQSLELNSTLEVMPVTDPNSMACVLFDGYEIW